MNRIFSFDIQTLLKSNDISPKIQSHLSKVYLTLALTLISCVLGVVMHNYVKLGSFFSFILSFGCIFFIYSNTGTFSKVKFLLAFGFLQGLSLGPMLSYTIKFSGSTHLIGVAFFLTSVIFFCFSAAAIISARRNLLYIYGFIGSLMSILFFMTIFSFFFTMPSIFTRIYLILGLVVFSLYIIVDTQKIIYQVDNNFSDNYVKHALDLFIDFISIFIRILAILMDSEKKKKKEKD